jgi:uncharacterized OB-fold protein
MAEQVPLVDYLVLDDAPHLLAHECAQCGARYFDHRNACAHCFGAEFRDVPVAGDGEVQSFTIVSFAAPVVDCDGTWVKGNIINTPADPDHVRLGMKVRLATYVVGTDSAGTEAIGFGFEPA